MSVLSDIKVRGTRDKLLLQADNLNSYTYNVF